MRQAGLGLSSRREYSLDLGSRPSMVEQRHGSFVQHSGEQCYSRPAHARACDGAGLCPAHQSSP